LVIQIAAGSDSLRRNLSAMVCRYSRNQTPLTSHGLWNLQYPFFVIFRTQTTIYKVVVKIKAIGLAGSVFVARLEWVWA
jgi:hypothetical protein